MVFSSTTSDWTRPHLFSASQVPADQLGSSLVALHRRMEMESRLVGWGGNGILQYLSPAIPTKPRHAHQATPTEPVRSNERQSVLPVMSKMVQSGKST
ncbi:hypothetical protein L345_15280, partial [Ophiophagus hannah]